MQLLVLASGRQWCAAIDLATGGLVSAHWAGPRAPLEQLTVAGGSLAGGPEVPDPMRPEAITLAAAPEPAGRMSRRRAERLMRPLLHPETEHVLGFAGPAIPYWTLAGDRASVAVLGPRDRPVVVAGECRFRWRNAVHRLPVLPTALAACPLRPRRLVVTLSPPRAGHCYKVVAALL